LIYSPRRNPKLIRLGRILILKMTWKRGRQGEGLISLGIAGGTNKMRKKKNIMMR
jgi:hypothetical protein